MSLNAIPMAVIPRSLTLDRHLPRRPDAPPDTSTSLSNFGVHNGTLFFPQASASLPAARPARGLRQGAHHRTDTQVADELASSGSLRGLLLLPAASQPLALRHAGVPGRGRWAGWPALPAKGAPGPLLCGVIASARTKTLSFGG